MVSCPNCGEKVRNNFVYCRICGCLLEGGDSEDHITDLLNVFKHSDEYLYLFCERGNQVVLKAESLEELEGLVSEKQYPWGFKDWKNNVSSPKKETLPSPEVKTEFLKASALKEAEIIPTSSIKKQKDNTEESYTPDYEVSRVVE